MSKKELKDVSEARIKSDTYGKSVTCPACKGQDVKCDLCGGVREVSEAKAIRYNAGEKN